MLLADIAMTVLPPLASVPQLLILREKKNIGSFSIYVPAILLIANIMRIFFWITVGYSFNLLIQSLLMIVMQVALSLSSSYYSSSVWRYLTTQSSSLLFGKSSGSGRLTNNTVLLSS